MRATVHQIIACGPDYPPPIELACMLAMKRKCESWGERTVRPVHTSQGHKATVEVIGRTDAHCKACSHITAPSGRRSDSVQQPFLRGRGRVAGIYDLTTAFYVGAAPGILESRESRAAMSGVWVGCGGLCWGRLWRMVIVGHGGEQHWVSAWLGPVSRQALCWGRLWRAGGFLQNYD